ncbi:unnamed protein product [Enterobius vermicularis]|uniref:Uncharacterized protein n=1 Tax=Enterobius vermicularis TaxID=51028 RepID=A0A0N4UWM0_ENTVE|nr:unnamed protein product [Enterobius vermicularis]
MGTVTNHVTTTKLRANIRSAGAAAVAASTGVAAAAAVAAAKHSFSAVLPCSQLFGTVITIDDNGKMRVHKDDREMVFFLEDEKSTEMMNAAETQKQKK